MQDAALKTETQDQRTIYRSLLTGCNRCIICPYYDRAIAEPAISKALAEEFPPAEPCTLVLQLHGVTLSDQRHIMYKVIGRWLKAGCKIIAETRGDMDLLTRLVREFNATIEYRIEIGAADPNVLRRWEPKCPDMAARLIALRYLNINPRPVSVLIRYYDPSSCDLVDMVKHYVTEGIAIERWTPEILGLAGDIPPALQDAMSNAAAWMMYARFGDNPLVRWGTSIRKLIEGA